MYQRRLEIKWERPYQHDSTASRLLSEVKHARARLVLRWGTTLESRVLFSFPPFFFARSDNQFATWTKSKQYTTIKQTSDHLYYKLSSAYTRLAQNQPLASSAVNEKQNKTSQIELLVKLLVISD